MKITVLIAMMALAIVSNCFAAESISLKKELKANFFRFSWMRGVTEIEHRETSSSADFVALGRNVRIAENNFDFVFGREFFRKYIISLSPYVLGRLVYGIKSDDEVKYEESLQGVGFGAGISLNVNTIINKTRTQFFISLQQAQQENQYFLRHEDPSTDERSRELSTKEKLALTQAGFGVRFFNLYNGYTFDITVHANGFQSSQPSQKASQGDLKFNSIEGSLFSRDRTSFSLGLGSTF